MSDIIQQGVVAGVVAGEGLITGEVNVPRAVGGVYIHNELEERDAAGAHPISAVEGLVEELARKVEIVGTAAVGAITTLAADGRLECCGLSADGIVDELDDKLEDTDLTELSNADVLSLWNKYVE